MVFSHLVVSFNYVELFVSERSVFCVLSVCVHSLCYSGLSIIRSPSLSARPSCLHCPGIGREGWHGTHGGFLAFRDISCCQSTEFHLLVLGPVHSFLPIKTTGKLLGVL